MATHRQEPNSPRNGAGLSDRQRNARKRNRYVLHACDRCRAAKVRCNGSMPCAYCVLRDPDSCQYTAPRFPQELERHRENQLWNGDIGQISTLVQEQNSKLDTVLERLSALEELHHRRRTSSKSDSSFFWAKEPLPLLQSSTSPFFTICIADATVKAVRQSTVGSSTSETSNPTTPPSSFSILRGQIVNEVSFTVVDGNFDAPGWPTVKPTLEDASVSPARPLDNLEAQEILRLIHVYQDFAGMMYPLVDVAHMEQRVRDLWMNDTGQGVGWRRSDQLSRNDLATLHIMIAIGSIIDNENGSDLIQSLHDSLWPDADSMVWNGRVDLAGLVLLTLMSLYYYYANKWRVAWRLVGNIARITLELGLNRQVVLNRSFPNRDLRDRAINTVWTVFVLEQQLSYALGLVPAICDLRLEPDFPRPVEAPYLEAMVQYARIGAQAYESLLGEKNTGITESNNCQELYSYIQYRIEEWRKAIATSFQFPSTDERTERWNSRLRTVLHMRANNLCIVICRCVLFETKVQGPAPLDLWDSSVDAAAETSQILARMDNAQEISVFEKSRSNYFLIAALGISFLAILQDQSPLLSASFVKEAVLMAPATYLKAQQTARLCLDLLRSRAASSRHSLRLWERVQGMASRPNISALPIPTSTSSSTETWHPMIHTPGIDEQLRSRAELPVDMQLESLDRVIQMDFSNQEGQTEDLSMIFGMTSGLDMTFDPTLFGSEFGE